jgi:hypothetical protein
MFNIQVIPSFENMFSALRVITKHTGGQFNDQSIENLLSGPEPFLNMLRVLAQHANRKQVSSGL